MNRLLEFDIGCNASFQVGDGFFQVGKSGEQQSKSDQRFTGSLGFGFADKEKRQAHTDDGQGDGRDAELANPCDQPCCDSGAQVGPHDDTDRFGECEQACIDKTYH